MEGVIDDASVEAQKFMNKTETNRVSEPKKKCKPPSATTSKTTLKQAFHLELKTNHGLCTISKHSDKHELS